MKDCLTIIRPGSSRLGRLGFKSQDGYHSQGQILNTIHDFQLLPTLRKNSETFTLMVCTDITQTEELYATNTMGE